MANTWTSDSGPAQAAFDVLIVGGGMAGAATAAVLGRRELKVGLVDPNADFPPLFRAEKVEPEQAQLLQRLGLHSAVAQRSAGIKQVLHALHGRVVHRRKVDQLGIAYQQMVEAVRDQIPPQVLRRLGRVSQVDRSGALHRVTLSDGGRLEARLLVIACGMPALLSEQVGARKEMVHAGLSMVYGFTLEPEPGRDFGFDSLTYQPRGRGNLIGYITLFAMRSQMRVNVFAYWDARDAVAREMQRDPLAALDRLAPGLANVCGPSKLVSKVEPFKIDLYRMAAAELPGIVLIGDAFQSPCPSTGKGLSKVLTDVDVLCNDFVPRWQAEGGTEAPDVGSYYSHPQKRAVDDEAIRLALAGRDAVISDSWRWRIRRQVRTLRFATGL
jgi:2-polyprenyl-6-methoxyphenol hydroxylase-like FAD-dependent oxidoreductase